MSGTDLAQLAKLTDTLYRAEQARMQTLIRDEDRLRAALARLDKSRKSALSLPESAIQAQRRIGADLLWQGWLARNRATLNRQLALVLAQKARQLAALRRAYGRHQATQSLQLQDQALRVQAQNRRDLVIDQSLTLLNTAQQHS